MDGKVLQMKKGELALQSSSSSSGGQSLHRCAAVIDSRSIFNIAGIALQEFNTRRGLNMQAR